MLALLVGAASTQNSSPTVYAENFRRGPTRITEDKFELKLTPGDPSYKQRLRDSSGAERYKLTITPKIGEGEGNDKIRRGWLGFTTYGTASLGTFCNSIRNFLKNLATICTG
jgi:hypothetical protein